MNKTILMGRLTKDPEVKYLQDENSTAMARYTLAVDSDIERMERQKQILFPVSPLGRMLDVYKRQIQRPCSTSWDIRTSVLR